MFIIRWFINILATLGFLLTAAIGYAAVRPLSVEAVDPLDLTGVLQCQATKFNLSDTLSNNSEFDKLKQTLGANSPIELVNQFTQTLATVTKSVATKPELSVSYCTTPDSNAKTLEKVKAFMQTQKKNYTYGSLADYIGKLNQLPFAKVATNFELNVPSVFVRSTYCNAPLNKSDFYIFTNIGSGAQNIAIMFNIHLVPDISAPQSSVYTSNIIQSAQYIKKQIYCNGSNE